MAYGDYWKVVSREDYDKIQAWIDVHDFEDVNTEAVDVAYLLFGDKYGSDIELVEWVEPEALIDEETGEEYFEEEATWQYTDSDFCDDTIEYHIANDEKVRKVANDMAQNSWRYAGDLIPEDADMTFEDYDEQLERAGYMGY